MSGAPRLLIKGGMLFDGHNDAVRSSDILVEGETIAADAPVIDVEPGRLADLALFAGNITEDVAVATRISHVVKSGRLYDSRALLGVAEPDVSRYFPLAVAEDGRPVLKL